MKRQFCLFMLEEDFSDKYRARNIIMSSFTEAFMKWPTDAILIYKFK